MLSTEISLSDLSLSERSSFKTVPGSGIGLKLRPVRSSVHKAERMTAIYQFKLKKEPYLFVKNLTMKIRNNQIISHKRFD